MTIHPDLLIPATAELLDGWCGPATMESQGVGWVEGAILGGHAVHVSDHGRAYVGPVDSTTLPHIVLDLSRAECRDRTARVFSRTLGRSTPNGVTWLHSRWRRRSCWHLFAHGAPLVDGDPNPPSRPARFGGHFWRNTGWYRCVPALAGLDPSDDTRLPDGSRLVDARALALCWHAVAGGAA